MKNKIMEKLLNDENLTTEEILYLSANLKESEVLPYNHEEKSTDAAISLSKVEKDIVSQKIQNCFCDGDESFSVVCEKLEMLINSDVRVKRFILVSYISTVLTNSSLSSILRIIGR